jgi:molybdenum cofactor synthesis domain-containing protein
MVRNMKKLVKLEDAVGMIIPHDITEIRRGSVKGPAFKKGHKIREADICHLQRLGKRHIYILKIEEGYLHENDAAVAMAEAFCGPGVTWQGDPVEGKLKLSAARDGLLYVNVDAVGRINMLGDVMCASRHTHSMVREGDVVAATRAIPLVVEEKVVDQAVTVARSDGGLVQVRPLKKARAGIIMTGNEIFAGLVQDQFEPILRRKLSHIGSEVIGAVAAPDDADDIKEKIWDFLNRGVDLILTTGGLSVDPDDVTRQAVLRAGASDFVYGASVLPGAMFMIAYLDSVPVMGIPACGIYHEITLFDLLLPRVLAGERITRKDIAVLGHGGLCLDCTTCRYPMCPFGKGV